MTTTIQGPRHKLLTKLIQERRESASLTQTEVATALGRYQSYIANIETGQRRIDVIEFLDLAQAIRFDPFEVLEKLVSKKPNARIKAPKHSGSKG